MRPYQLICITGPDGAGKSTLIDALQKELPGSVIASIWDLLREPSRQAIIPFHTPQEVDRYLSCLYPESRSLFLLHCLMEGLEIAKEKNPAYILTDSYWYKYYATEMTHGTSPVVLNQLVSVFEKPDYLFYMDAPEKLTAERKKNFSGYECGFAPECNEQTFSAFQRRAIRILQSLMHKLPAVTLNPEALPAENLAIIMRSLNIADHENNHHYRH